MPAPATSSRESGRGAPGFLLAFSLSSLYGKSCYAFLAWGRWLGTKLGCKEKKQSSGNSEQ